MLRYINFIILQSLTNPTNASSGLDKKKINKRNLAKLFIIIFEKTTKCYLNRSFYKCIIHIMIQNIIYYFILITFFCSNHNNVFNTFLVHSMFVDISSKVKLYITIIFFKFFSFTGLTTPIVNTCRNYYKMYFYYIYYYYYYYYYNVRHAFVHSMLFNLHNIILDIICIKWQNKLKWLLNNRHNNNNYLINVKWFNCLT